MRSPSFCRRALRVSLFIGLLGGGVATAQSTPTPPTQGVAAPKAAAVEAPKSAAPAVKVKVPTPTEPMKKLLSDLQLKDQGRQIIYSRPPKVPFTAAQLTQWKLDGTWTLFAWRQRPAVGQFSLEGDQLVFTDNEKRVFRGAIQPKTDLLVLVYDKKSWAVTLNLTRHSDGQLRGYINHVTYLDDEEEADEDDLFAAVLQRQ